MHDAGNRNMPPKTAAKSQGKCEVQNVGNLESGHPVTVTE